MSFELISDFQPAGDQPQAIDALVEGITNKKPHQILLGVTGSGKTFSIANVIATVNKPTLVIAPNKTLAAQLCAEFRHFFPHNAVEYFVSYYDYYQPEAYVPTRDIYIEKEADINEEIDRLRHRATRSLLSRRDVIIVASVSCIYGLGTPEDYIKGVQKYSIGDTLSRRNLLIQLERIQYERNDIELKRGRYRVHGDVVDIFPSWEDKLLRLSFFGDTLEDISTIHPITADTIEKKTSADLYPATHYVVLDTLETAIKNIKTELQDTLNAFKTKEKLLEAHRLEQRTNYDIEMMHEMGYCKGIENYSRHISGRAEGEAPGVLIDFFPDDFLTIIDESHVTIPQLKGMYKGDRARKTALIDYGFRLPSAFDNRPLQFEEIMSILGPTVFISATPGPFELSCCQKSELVPITPDNPWANYDIVEQVIRPTGLVDPDVIVKPTKHQIDDLMAEISHRIKRQERVLITTLTKKMSEELTDYLQDKNIKVQYIHSEIHGLERIDILHDLRTGKYDVLVGVNLLREGLDLPEVSLVAIMDADKEGFLRNERSLIQTMGRAARNVAGRVILYADKTTESMKNAIQEAHRRRTIQKEYNRRHGITPTTIKKEISDIRDKDRALIKEAEKAKTEVAPDKLPDLLARLEKEMHAAAEQLDFELAAVLRDQIRDLEENT